MSPEKINYRWWSSAEATFIKLKSFCRISIGNWQNQPMVLLTENYILKKKLWKKEKQLLLPLKSMLQLIRHGKHRITPVILFNGMPRQTIGIPLRLKIICSRAENFLIGWRQKIEALDLIGGTYDKVIPYQLIEYTIGDGRKVKVQFFSRNNKTFIEETFEAEIKIQLTCKRPDGRQSWTISENIVNRFKKSIE